MFRKTLFVAIAALPLYLACPSKAEAWGAYHVGYTHVGPAGAYHVGSTGYHYGATYHYGGYHYGGYGYGGYRYGYVRRW